MMITDAPFFVWKKAKPNQGFRMGGCCRVKFPCVFQRVRCDIFYYLSVWSVLRMNGFPSNLGTIF